MAMAKIFLRHGKCLSSPREIKKSRLVSFPKTVFRKKKAAKTVYEFCGVANYLVAAMFLFAAKIMFMPCNNNSNAYIIATLL